MNTKHIGDRGEESVCNSLKGAGYRIIERNVRYKTGEIDIVALKEGVVHFIEVKSVQASSKVNPADNIHREKVRKIARTALWYLAHHKIIGSWQIDAALVWIDAGGESARIELIKNIYNEK